MMRTVLTCSGLETFYRTQKVAQLSLREICKEKLTTTLNTLCTNTQDCEDVVRGLQLTSLRPASMPFSMSPSNCFLVGVIAMLLLTSFLIVSSALSHYRSAAATSSQLDNSQIQRVQMLLERKDRELFDVKTNLNHTLITNEHLRREVNRTQTENEHLRSEVVECRARAQKVLSELSVYANDDSSPPMSSSSASKRLMYHQPESIVAELSG